MFKKSIHIIIIEPSPIICEGLSSILSNPEGIFDVQRINTLEDLTNYAHHKEIDIIIINPALVQNNSKVFNNFKNNLPDTRWIGIVYSFFESKLLSLFDGIINVYDTPELINNLMRSVVNKGENEQTTTQEKLSDREIEVLKLLALGNQNKEIADKLNISTYTVISHRKNISQKTGIKSVSGLTIYAVVKNIMTLEDFQE